MLPFVDLNHLRKKDRQNTRLPWKACGSKNTFPSANSRATSAWMQWRATNSWRSLEYPPPITEATGIFLLIHSWNTSATSDSLLLSKLSTRVLFGDKLRQGMLVHVNVLRRHTCKIPHQNNSNVCVVRGPYVCRLPNRTRQCLQHR